MDHKKQKSVYVAVFLLWWDFFCRNTYEKKLISAMNPTIGFDHSSFLIKRLAFFSLTTLI